MRHVAIVLAGLLLAAGLHFVLMPDAERARILQVAPSSAASSVAAADADVGIAALPASDATPVASAVAAPMPELPVDTGTVPPDAAPIAAPPPSGLLVPVQGIAPSQLSSTFDDDRGEGRVHEALDIMAPAGTPVLAVADGHVEKLFDSDRGGLTIYQFEPGGEYAYYYAHLERYAPGLEEQQQVRRGEVIGYVGSTGNADPAAPHLHFAIFLLGPEKRWWEGTAIDPYPLLADGAR
ncbi:M23 family metallopeptidase [Luteimonas arsenica]|uniref:M23 family metallopeptidase n=1 Tax=Luteimonas arsenica TaxID=1586242 RepID=UPI003CCCE582